MAEMNVSGSDEYNDSTIDANQSGVNYTGSTIDETLHDVIFYVVLTLGIPGNILSAIVWLQRHIIGKNSSAVYLAALAIDDLVFLLFRELDLIGYNCDCYDHWFYHTCTSLFGSASTLESLLVLGFSVERLLAILRPLQVGYGTSVVH